MTHQDVFEVVIDNFLNGPCDFDPRGLPSLIYDNPIAPRIFSVFLLRIFAYNGRECWEQCPRLVIFGKDRHCAPFLKP